MSESRPTSEGSDRDGYDDRSARQEEAERSEASKVAEASTVADTSEVAELSDGRARRPYTFVLDSELVEAARREVGESDVVRSIEAALAAALDYQLWIREVAAGERDVLA